MFARSVVLIGSQITAKCDKENLIRQISSCGSQSFLFLLLYFFFLYFFLRRLLSIFQTLPVQPVSRHWSSCESTKKIKEWWYSEMRWTETECIASEPLRNPMKFKRSCPNWGDRFQLEYLLLRQVISVIKRNS